MASNEVNVEILQAVPAAGKTKAILKHVLTTKRRTLIASISCQLSQQSYDFYRVHGGRDSAIIDSDHITRSTSVRDALKHAIESDTRVLFITHAALIESTDFDLLSDFDLYIDEVPEFVNITEMKFTDNIHLITKYCDLVDNTLVLKESKRKQVEAKAFDGIAGTDVVSERLFKLLRALLQGTPVMIKDNIAYFIDDCTTLNWSVFRRITIACANFDGTFTGTIVKYYCKWKVKKSPLHDKLDFHEYRNTSRVEIVPLYSGEWSRYASEKEVNGQRVYDIMKKKVYDLTLNVPYIYTTNRYRTQLQTGESVQYNPHGLNQYMNYTTAVALFSYNPTPWQIEILRTLSSGVGLSPSVFIDAFVTSKYLEPVFQLCTRTDIRNQFSDDNITLIVPDIRAAEYLKTRYLKNATITNNFVFEPPPIERKQYTRKKEQTPRAKRNTFANMFEFDKKELGKFYRWEKKQNKKLTTLSQEDIILVRDWISGIRSREEVTG